MKRALPTSLLALAVTLLAGCLEAERGYELDERSFDAKTLKHIEDATGLQLPAGARGLHYLYKPPIDPSFMAEIELPPGGERAMSEHVAEIKDNRGDMGLSQQVPAWWAPERGKVLIKREFFSQKSEHSLRAFLVEEGGKTVLYLNCQNPPFSDEQDQKQVYAEDRGRD